MRLNVEVIEAKDLNSKDPNGMADPFVTMFINSAPSHRYNTSVKPSTLCPMWEEHFSLYEAADCVQELSVTDSNAFSGLWRADKTMTI